MNRLLYLSRTDVEAVGLAMTEIIEALEGAFAEKAMGQTEMPPKPGVHPGGGDNFIHAMPAYIEGMGAAGIKWVGGFPENQKRGLPYISGLVILNDAETGLPISVMDCVWITGMRTGAATAVSAKHLARHDSSIVGVLGCGVQGRTNVEALNAVFGIRRVMAYDVNARAAEVYADEIQNRLHLEVSVVAAPREAVAGCDIIVTAGPISKTPHATIQPGWMDEGAFASLVDFDAYWHGDALKQADKFCTDDTAQMRYYQELGFFQGIPEIHGDLGELVAGRKPGRQSETERNIAANLGLAIDDMAVAPLIYKRAVAQKIGTWLPL